MNFATSKILLTVIVIALFLALGYLFVIQRQLANRVVALESQLLPEQQASQGGGQGRALPPTLVLTGFQTITGSVIKIENNQFAVLAQVPIFINFSDPRPPATAEKTFVISVAKTTVFNAVPADKPDQKTALKGLADLKVGDMVSATAAEDLLYKTEFTAKEITVIRP